MRPADTGRQKDRTYAVEDRLYRVDFFFITNRADMDKLMFLGNV